MLAAGIEMPRQPVNLLHVENRIALHEGDFALGFQPLRVGLGLGDPIGIDHQRTMFARAHLRAQGHNLPVGQPDWGGVSLEVGFAPQQQNIDAAI